MTSFTSESGKRMIEAAQADAMKATRMSNEEPTLTTPDELDALAAPAYSEGVADSEAGHGDRTMTRDEFNQQLIAIRGAVIANRYYECAEYKTAIDVDDMSSFDGEADAVCELWAKSVMSGKGGGEPFDDEAADPKPAHRWLPHPHGPGEVLFRDDGSIAAEVFADGMWIVRMHNGERFSGDAIGGIKRLLELAVGLP